MEQVQAFVASDGALFLTSGQCQDYELSLIWRERINEFSASGINPYPNGPQAGIVRKAIIAWERFKVERA